MSKLISFDIELTNPSGAYFAGETVRGSVTVNIAEDETCTPEEAEAKRFKAVGMLTVKVKGKAHTYWHTAIEETRRKFGEKEKYFDEPLPLYRKGQEKMEVPLIPGERKFLFRFTLPWEVPSTFEEKKGFVIYYVKANIKGLEREDIKTKKVFTVTGISDLNLSTDALQPKEIRSEKSIGCLCCQSGPVGFELKLPRTRFVPEETIIFDVEFFNMSKRIVTDVRVTLLQLTTYRGIEMAPRKTAWIFKKHENILDSMTAPPLQPGDVAIYDKSKIKIPAAPPTKLSGCNLIDVDYFMTVKMKVPYSFPLEGKIPIFIGTIPLRSDKLGNENENEDDNENGNCEESTLVDTEIDVSGAEYLPLTNGSKNSESVAPSEAAATSQLEDESNSLDDETRNSESTPLVETLPNFNAVPNNVAREKGKQ